MSHNNVDFELYLQYDIASQGLEQSHWSKRQTGLYCKVLFIVSSDCTHCIYYYIHFENIRSFENVNKLVISVAVVTFEN